MLGSRKTAPPLVSVADLQRAPLTRIVARVLVFTLLAWSVPVDAWRPRAAAAGQGTSTTQAAPETLWVNADATAACDGETPCFTSIQRAIDAVGPGGRVVVQAGEYFEQLRIARKNRGALVTAADRIVIEADPEAPTGSVVLRGHPAACEGGWAVELDRSRYVTLRGLTIVGAGVRGIGLRGGSRQSVGIHLEALRLARGGPRECNGGIDVGRGNPETVIANSLIYGNGRNGIRFRDGRGGSYYVVGNTIARNAWSGIQVTQAAAVEIANNLIFANGLAAGAPAARVGVRRLRSSLPAPQQVRLLGNVICGNRGGELSGPMLDGADADNLTPSGGEGQGVVASATCAQVEVMLADLAGADGELDTADDVFTLAPGSPAVDAGVDPRALAYPAPSALLESHFFAPGARPADGDADGVAAFDAGAIEMPGDAEPTPSASPTPTPTASPSPSPSASPSPTPTPVPNRPPTIVSTPVTRIVVAVPEIDPPEPSFDFLELTPTDLGSDRSDVFSTLPTSDPALFGFTGSDVRRVNFDTTPTGTPLASGTQLTSEYASAGVLMSSIPISSGVYGGAASPPNATFIGPIGGQQSFTFTVPVVAVGIINTSPDQDRIAFYSPSGELMFSIRDQDALPGPNFNVDRFVGARVTDSNLIGSIVFQNEAGNDEFDELIFEVSTAQLPRADYVYDCDATDPDLDTLTYALLEGPPGMQVDPASGVVTWTPTSLDVGTHTVEIRVEDGRGGVDQQQYQLEVVEQPVVPNVIGGTGDQAAETLEAAGFVLGAVTGRFDPQPAGTVLGQTPLGGSRAPAGSAVDIVLSLGPAPTPTPVVTPPTPTPVPTSGAGAPLARDDAYGVRTGETLVVPAPGVLDNDEDPDGDALTAQLVDPPAIGSLDAFNADGSFTYRAPASFVQPGLEPGVLMRTVHGISGFGQVADFDHDGRPDIAYDEFGALRALSGQDLSRLWEYDPSDTTNVDVAGCSTATNTTLAVGDVDDSGDVSIVKPINCDDTRTVGFSDRFVAINGSQITAGKIRASWVTERLTKPHPDAYVDGSASAPADPPIRPQFAATSFTNPSLARLEADGGVKLLARRMVSQNEGGYLTRNEASELVSRQAGCRAMTGVPADEGVACRVTWIIDAASGAVEQVLRAPNTSNEADVFSWRPWRQNAPTVADLDGDGEVEIVSGSDVFKRVGGVWQLDWQSTFEPASVAVADLDGDGTSEVVQYQFGIGGTRSETDSGILVYAHDGTLIRRIPVNRNHVTSGLVSIGDADGDGAPDILHVSDGLVYVFRADGRLLWVFLIPDRPEPLNGLVPGAVALFGRSGETAAQVYDLDLDGRPEVILNAAARLFIFDGASGAEKWSIDTEGIPFGPKTLALADVDDDGHVDIVASTANRWNCSVGGGPVPCLGNTLVVRGQRLDWAPGPKVFDQLQFRADAVDDDAKILFAPGARRDFRRAAQQGTVTDPRLREGATFTYRASDGASSSSTATAFIDVRPDNSAPVITSVPPTGLRSQSPYTRPVYQITAADPDPGDTIRYELVSSTHPFGHGPPWGTGFGVGLDAATGAVDFYVGPCGSFGGPCDLGDVVVTVAAIDLLGARTEQAFVVTIGPNVATVPNVVGQLLEAAIDAITAVSLRARVVLETFAPEPAGTVLAQSPAGGTSDVPLGTSVELTLSKGPEPTPVPTATPDPDATPTPVPTAGPPLASIVVEPVDPILLAGETEQLVATGVFEDGTSADLTMQVAWASGSPAVASVGATGLATGLAAGTSTITATLGALSGATTLTVEARVTDVVPPVAQIASPVANAEVTQPIDVVGTASDASFLRYELAIGPAGESTFTTIQTGTSQVTDGALGRLDPTLLINDQYTLRLTVFDRGGNETTAEVVVQVLGDMKLGHFGLLFVDLSVPLSGVPITVGRVYDSRDARRGDFGVGWRLDVQTLRLRTNRVLGTGWVRSQSGPVISLSPTDEHKVSLTLPDGTVEEFDMQVAPTSGFGALDFTSVTGFTPRPGTLGTLEALVGGDLLILAAGAQDELVDENTLDTYDPQLFRYTSVDGTQIEIHRRDGVRKVTERNGNVLTFGPNGIVHSAGKSVTFTRDALGRITQITDPAGASQSYAYDANGDLARHTNLAGNETRYGYDRAHRLLSITDPTGARVARNEYDDTGRLVATTDPQGNRIELGHDVDASREVVRDRLGQVTVLEYDAAGKVVAKTDALGGRTTYTYDARGNELTETDALGRTASKTYDARGNVLTSTDVDGHTTTYTYDTSGRVLTTTDPEGRTTTNVYDGAGNLTQTTDAGGGVHRYSYDGSGNRVSAKDPLGNETTFAYDAFGNETSRTDALGGVTTFGYDANGRLVSETRPGGSTTAQEYDAAGRRTRTTNALGDDSSFTYSPIGDGQKVATLTRENGAVMRLDYDERGNLVTTTYGDGSTTVTTYDAENRTTSRTDRDGRTTSFEHDALGRQTEITPPDGTTVRKTYDAIGRVLTRTDERGNVTTYAYAANRRTVTDPLGNVTVDEFDGEQRRVKSTDALGRVTTFAYDAHGNLTLTTYADGSTRAATYDLAGRKTSETDQAGRTTEFEYDALGRLTQVTDAAGASTTYGYDAAGNLVEQTDANGHTTRMEYDAAGRLTKRIRPLGQLETFAYDAAGNQTSHTDFNGRTTSFAYDAGDRLRTKTLPDGAVLAFAYTPSGLRTQAGDETYAYDARGRLIEETKAGGAKLTYAYDEAGNRTSMTTPLGTTAYTYDALNRLSTVLDANGTTTYAYDPVGKLVSATHPNGITTTYDYDVLDRLVQVTNGGPAGLVSSYTYTLGPAGDRLQVVEAGPATSGRTVSYAYDTVGRLAAEVIDGPGPGDDRAIGYVYDAVGNRTQMTRDGVVTAYAYDANDRLLSEATGAVTVTYEYDDNGNLIRRSDGSAVASYDFDDENRLIGADLPAGTVSYAYDADGIRIGKTAGGVSTEFLVDKNRPYAQVVVETTGTTTATYTHGHQPISQTRTGAGTHFYVSDGQLSIRQLTTPAGLASGDSYTYDAFGVTLDETGTTENVYRYAGEQLDPSVDLYYLRARYYDQAAGRFVGADPLQGRPPEPATLHRYLYANANPVTYADPSGQFSVLNVVGGLLAFGLILATTYVLTEAASFVGGLFAHPMRVPIDAVLLKPSSSNGLKTPWTLEEIQAMSLSAYEIWRRYGVYLTFDFRTEVNDDYLFLAGDGDGRGELNDAVEAYYRGSPVVLFPVAIEDVGAGGASTLGLTAYGRRGSAIGSRSDSDIIIAHELGHVFGLIHNAFSSNLMYATPETRPMDLTPLQVNTARSVISRSGWAR
ncbi:MAG: PASTA domain-containing protein [Thermodesulfobacteriota bacterium]